MKSRIFLFFIFLFFYNIPVSAQSNSSLWMSEYYSDFMIFQHETPIHISGKAASDKKISVSINDVNYSTITDKNNNWSVEIEPLKAGGPYTLVVSTSSDTLRYSDVLAGEVWLCSGQSNMEFMLQQTPISKEELSQINDSSLRLFDRKARYRTNHVQWSNDVLDSIQSLHYYSPTKWYIASSQSVSPFSAVAYHFGKMLRDSLNIPIGLICNAIGGSPIESWIDETELEARYPMILNDWNNNNLIQEWVRQRASYNIRNASHNNQKHPYMPGYLYATGIKPLINLPIKGVVWYQGESNAQDAKTHGELFKLLVDNWRAGWNNPSMPFYYVQLSSLNRETWPEFRDSQRKLLTEISNTGMAVSSDWGDSLDVHPVNKKPIGERLALLALHNTYQFNVVANGPLFRRAALHDKQVILTFDYGKGLKSSDGMAIRGFEIAGEDGVYYPANVKIVNDSIVLSNKNILNPIFVRYGWKPYSTANLVNGAGLPASTFHCSEIDQ